MNLLNYIIIDRLRYWLLATIFIFSFSATAQKMSVESFELLENDLTANTQPNIKYDQNGDKCALIKIQTTQKGFMFDVGTLGIVVVVEQNTEHPGEIWLYVPHGVKKISIQHNLLGSITNYDLGHSLQKAKTYLLKLTSDQVNTLVVDYENNQFLYAKIEPKDAVFYINGVKQPQNANGTYELSLPFGTHTYRATATNYHTQEAQISINDKEHRHELAINLKQAFGYLTLDSDKEFVGADIFIDSTYIGQLPLKHFPLKSGIHSLLITKKLYLPHSQNFTITDSGFTNLKPILKSNYAEVELNVNKDKDALIYANGEFLGTGKWHGRLEAGEYTIEVKKLSHTTISRKISIKNNENKSFNFDNPKPIYGNIEIQTTPSDVEIYIDDNFLGKTPFISSQILVGEHKLKLIKKGYKTEIETITIEEGKTIHPNKTLTDYCNAMLYSTPTNADVYINDSIVGKTPYPLNLVAGSYKIALKARGYSYYSKSMKLNGSTSDISIKLRRNYTRSNEFYLQLGYNPFFASSITFGLGGYIQNFNIETNCIIGLKKSETIYWAEPSEIPVSSTYKPSAWDLKLGYGIRLNSRIRITPQIGYQYVGLKETIEDLNFTSSDYYYTTSTVANGANVMSMSVGARFNIALSPSIGFSITPQYKVPIYKSPGFDILSKTSHDISKYMSGFDGLINLNLFF